MKIFNIIARVVYKTNIEYGHMQGFLFQFKSSHKEVRIGIYFPAKIKVIFCKDFYSFCYYCSKKNRG